MTTKDTDTHGPTPADQPLALRLSEGLGPNRWYDEWQKVCAADHGEYPEDGPTCARLRWWVPKSSKYGALNIEIDMLEAAYEIERMREFLAIWIADGSLQTFEHREKFRAAAKVLLGA